MSTAEGAETAGVAAVFSARAHVSAVLRINNNAEKRLRKHFILQTSLPLSADKTIYESKSYNMSWFTDFVFPRQFEMNIRFFLHTRMGINIEFQHFQQGFQHECFE